MQTDPAQMCGILYTPAVAARRLSRIIKFTIVGIANTCTDVTLYTMAVIIFGWHPLLANTLSYSSGVLCSFLLNRTWTFADCNRSQPAQQFVRFIGVNTLTLCASSVVIAALLMVVPPVAAKGIAVIVGFALNYGFTRTFVFARAKGI